MPAYICRHRPAHQWPGQAARTGRFRPEWSLLHKRAFGGTESGDSFESVAEGAGNR